MKKIFYLIILAFLLILPKNVFALNEVNVYFFHDKDCSICEQERIYLQALKQDRYPNMRIYAYEINTDNNRELYNKAKKLFNETRNGVPFTVVGDKVFYGFSQGKKGEFQQAVYTYSTNKYENKLGKELGITYRTDLQGTVKQYKENTDYVIEEKSGKTPTPTTPPAKVREQSKYTNSIILITAGIILLIIYIILKIKERREY